MDFRFSPQILNSVVGGLSTIDIQHLNIQNLEEAHLFLKTYGYDLADKEALAAAWAIHKRAIIILRDRLLDPGESIPEELIHPETLRDPGTLLIYASRRDNKNIQAWSCSILRVMHVLAHLEDDFFNVFSEKIRETIFKPFRDRISSDPLTGISLGLGSDHERIKLQRFDVKNMKSLDSAALKLLAKPEVTAMQIYDKIGVRFVTKTLFDVFRVVRFLVDEHLISFPNIMPDQARNTLYPVNLFLEAMEETKKRKPKLTDEELDPWLLDYLEKSLDRAEYKERRNDFSGRNYRSMKFIARRLIDVESGGNRFHFFYPYEIQIMDYDTYLKNISGPEAHEHYKRRQRLAARRRALPHLKQEEPV